MFRALLFARPVAGGLVVFPPDRRATAMGLVRNRRVLGKHFPLLVGPLLVGRSTAGVRLSWLSRSWAFARPFPYHFMGRSSSGRQEARWACWTRCSFSGSRSCGVRGHTDRALRRGDSFPSGCLHSSVFDRGLSLQRRRTDHRLERDLPAFANLFGGYVSDRLKNPHLVIGGVAAVLACTRRCS